MWNVNTVLTREVKRLLGKMHSAWTAWMAATVCLCTGWIFGRTVSEWKLTIEWGISIHGYNGYEHKE